MTLAALSDYFDLNKLMGMLPNHSEHGKEIDHMLNFCHWFMLALFVGWGIFFLVCIIRFRKGRNPKADYHGVRSHLSTHLEIGVVIIEAVILLGFALPLWGKRVGEIPDDEKDGALKIRAIGYQFGWNFHYAGPDGKFGRQHIRFITGSNVLGLDPTDPDGADDVVATGTMHLVNHKATVTRVSSKDVIHGFALHQMRIQQDAIPGTEAPQWFRPVSTGEWQIICAQLCGTGHSQMAANYIVEEQKDFDVWYKDQLEATQRYLQKQKIEVEKLAEADKAEIAKKAAEHGEGHGDAHGEKKGH
jgi:cytochrome c oxidase subunit 2